MVLDYQSTKHTTRQVSPTMFLFNRDMQNHFSFLNKITNLLHQVKAKRNDSNSKIKFKERYDITLNVNISDIKVGDTILVKQQKYKTEPFTVTEKKGTQLKQEMLMGMSVLEMQQMCVVFGEALILCIMCRVRRG